MIHSRNVSCCIWWEWDKIATNDRTCFYDMTHISEKYPAFDISSILSFFPTRTTNKIHYMILVREHVSL